MNQNADKIKRYYADEAALDDSCLWIRERDFDNAIMEINAAKKLYTESELKTKFSNYLCGGDANTVNLSAKQPLYSTAEIDLAWRVWLAACEFAQIVKKGE